MPGVDDERRTYREREGSLTQLADKVSISNAEAIAPSVVRAVMNQVLDRIKPTVLAEALEARGLSSNRGRYTVPTIYRWAQGGIMPPANVLLEAARIANVSLDGYLYPSVEEEAVGRSEFEREIRDLRQTLAELQTTLAAHQEALMAGKEGGKRTG